MKSIYKIFLLALGVYTSAFSQITEITRLPVQDISQSIKESTPLWLSENEIMIFFVNQTLDTIFSTLSTDRGKSWANRRIVQVINYLPPNQKELHLTALQSTTGRILIAWSVQGESMKLKHSDNRGGSWSVIRNILGGGNHIVYQQNSSLLNLIQWETGEICLSFWTIGSHFSNYKLSYDDGDNWSIDAIDFPQTVIFDTKELSINSVSSSTLLAVYERSFADARGIYYRISTDLGLNWSDPIVLSDEIYHETKPKVVKLENGYILVSYLHDDVDAEAGHGTNDIYYRISTDNGSLWSAEDRFTKYIGADDYLSVSSCQNKTFVSFATERYSVTYPYETNYQIVFGVIEESAELFTPPKVFSTEVPTELIDYENEKFVYRAKIIDDKSVKSVTVVLEDSVYIGEMFDDGMHTDGAANDSVFGNKFPFVVGVYGNEYNFSANKIELPMNNHGILADVNITYATNGTITALDPENNQCWYESVIHLGGSGSLGKFEGGGFLFSGGFFLSGYTNGALWTNAVASASLVEDYLPGTINSNPDDPLFGIYVINKDDIPFGSSWQGWKDAVLLGAEFYDGDGDGIYNPVDKNWNGTWDLNEDMPFLIGDEIAWCVYNDGLPRNQRRWNTVEQQGIEVRQTIFATDNPELENVIFIRYSILNTGSVVEVMDSVYFGVWEDADVGDATDDIVGCDTLLQSGFCYANSPDWVYGDNPPSFFTSLLQGPVIETNHNSDTAIINYGQIIGTEKMAGKKNLDISSHVFMIGGDPTLNDPGSVTIARNYLLGKNRVGQFPDPCTWAYGEVRGEVDCNQVNPVFWVSGDPVNNVGWISTQNRDVRNLVSAGPFKLEKDKPQEIIIADVIGRGTDYLNSITVARENVQRAIQEYQSNFASMTYTAPPPEPINNYMLHQNYPNPFNPTTTIRYELPQDGVVTIEIFDILGQKVKTVLSEFKSAGRYEVTLTSNGLASGVYIYQLRINEFITSKKMVLIR